MSQPTNAPKFTREELQALAALSAFEKGGAMDSGDDRVRFLAEETKRKLDEAESIIDSWGCPKYRRICLVCGGKEPCMKESDLKPEDPGIPCMFDMTFKEMIDTIHRLERQLRDKSRGDK